MAKRKYKLILKLMLITVYGLLLKELALTFTNYRLRYYIIV